MRFLIVLWLTAAAALAQAPRPWPATAVAGNFDVRIVAEDKATGTINYASPHFEMTSDVKLPLGVVRDLAAVFEATRNAVRGLPLGLEIAPEPKMYKVMFFSNANDYGTAGGAGGSGGYFNGDEMLLLLPNLGIQKSTNGLTLAHQEHIFVLKHEVTHQIMGPWLSHLPMWLREGMAECMAATPYVRGQYSFTGLDSALRDYLLKWRKTKDQRSLKLIPTAQLMALTEDSWQQQVSTQSAYDAYNSSALLTHWFLHCDGAGDGAGMAAFFAALPKDVPTDEALEKYLMRGRKPEKIDAELRVFCKRLALQVE